MSKGKLNRKARIVEYFNEQGGKCYLCSEEMTLQLNKHNTAEIEHIVPKSHRRVAGEYNEAAAGSACNRYKGDKPLYTVIADLREMKLCKG